MKAVDHGSFPNLESTDTAPLYELVKLGPELSVRLPSHHHLLRPRNELTFATQSERCRLALLAEQFIDVVTYRAPKEYKPTKANDVAVKDRAYLIDSFSRLHESLSTVLFNPPSTAAKLTGPEHKFYTTLTLLSALLSTALQTGKSDTPSVSLSTTVAGITSIITALHADLDSTPPQYTKLDMGSTLHSLTTPHTLSHLRETALATKQSTSFLLAFHAAEQTRDRSGKSNLHKDVVTQVKALDALATSTLSAGKARVAELKEALGQGGWLDRVEGWMFDEGDGLGELVRDVVGAGEVEEWAGSVVESWREGVKGFGGVVWE